MSRALKDLEEHLTSLSPPSDSAAIPGVVLLATSRDPSIPPYSFSCGVASLSPSRQPPPPLAPASSMCFASATKLLTSVAALQLVDSGMWSLDRPVAEALPEIASLRELESWSKEGKPIFADDINGASAGARITLRHLLTHTSGLAYDFLNPKLMRWWKWRGENEGRNVRADASGIVRGEYGGPLVRAPGSEWEFGPGVDWAGALVEKLHGEEQGRLRRVIQRDILAKVGVRDGEACWRRTELHWSEEEFAERWVDMTSRSSDGLVAAGPVGPENAKDDLGGAGIRCTPQAYFEVLQSLLRDDGRLLSRETADAFLFGPQLTDGKLGNGLRRSLQAYFASGPGGRMLTGGIPSPSPPKNDIGTTGDNDDDEYQFNHGLAGALCRKKGQKDWALHWGGMPNIQWFIDPAAGVAGLFATQTVPPADPLMLDLSWTYRQGVVEVLGKGKHL